MSGFIVNNKYKINNLNELLQLKEDDLDGKRRNIGNNWPIVYIMYNKDKKEIYIGQTINAFRRLKEHSKEKLIREHKLEDILIIYSKQANLSIMVNLENYLIRTMGAEKKNKIINERNSFPHEYYQKEKYEENIEEIWKILKKEKIVDKDLEEIIKLELYKLSPFVELNNNQNKIIAFSKDLIVNDKRIKDIVINGIPGTGKTILALYLAKEIKQYYDERESKMNIAIVTPLNNFNKTLNDVIKNINIFKGIKILSPIKAVNIYNRSKEKFDLLIIDEAHRLKFCRKGQAIKQYKEKCQELKLGKNGNVSEVNQLDWLKEISYKRVIFYDEFQNIRPDDLKRKELEKRVGIKINDEEKKNYFILKEPMRIKVDNYIEYIDNLLQITKNHGIIYKKDFFPEYELYMTRNLGELEEIIKKKANSRLIAGYAWEWISKVTNKKQIEKYKKNYDFKEYYVNGEYYRENILNREKPDFQKKWNNNLIGDWCNSTAAKELEEIGCVHTIQGYDVNYVGLLLGRDIIYRNGKVQVNRREYKDKGGFYKEMDDSELLRYIKNIYRILLTRGMNGTYIYVFDKELRKYLENYIYYYDETEHKNNKVADNQANYIN